MESNATDKSVPREITALLSDERLILRETQRAVTPFGGIAVFIFFLGKIGFVEAVRRHMPVRWRSPNHIDPSSTFTAFRVSVLDEAPSAALNAISARNALEIRATPARNLLRNWEPRSCAPNSASRRRSGTTTPPISGTGSTCCAGGVTLARQRIVEDRRDVYKSSRTMGVPIPALHHAEPYAPATGP